MKSNKEIIQNMGKFTLTDKQKIEQIKKDLDALKGTGGISQESVKILFNVQTQLHVLLEQYTNRLISLLKQNHMLD